MILRVKIVEKGKYFAVFQKHPLTQSMKFNNDYSFIRPKPENLDTTSNYQSFFYWF